MSGSGSPIGMSHTGRRRMARVAMIRRRPLLILRVRVRVSTIRYVVALGTIFRRMCACLFGTIRRPLLAKRTLATTTRTQSASVALQIKQKECDGPLVHAVALIIWPVVGKRGNLFSIPQKSGSRKRTRWCYRSRLRGHYRLRSGSRNRLDKLMIRKLREDWVAKHGGRAAWKSFHDAFLSYGGRPILLVHRAMAVSRPTL
jgi:hypothetical protein